MSTSSFTKLRSHVKGSFILRADIEGQVSCSVSARDGLSIRDIFWEKLENTGGRKWENFLVYTKWTRVHIEWEMNCSCVRGHALLIINKLDKLPVPLPGAHHFIRKDVINAAAGRYCEKDFYYIIRPSGSAKNLGSFALVITTPSFPSGKSCIRHVTVAYNKDTDNFSLCSKEFDSLDSLVNYFKTTPIKAHNGPNMYLRNPIPVDPQLDEDCKKPWRTTRTGQRTADTPGGVETDQTPDTISLWSCSSSLTPNSYSLSYDYDGSVSGLSCSEDDQSYEYNRSAARDKFRCPTVINRDVPSPMSPVSDLSLSHHSYSDVEMRAQSGSSSGASQSGGSVSSSASFRRSQFFYDTKPSSMKLQRPFSEVLMGGAAEHCTIDPSRTKSVPQTFLVRQTPEGEICPIEPEETYVEMTLTAVQEFHLSAPAPSCPEIRTDTMVRVDNEHSRTLTRGDADPESCYINMNTINQEISAPEPSETYVEMSQVRRPSPPSDHHVYVNRPARPASPSNTTTTDPRSGYDPVTTQKLIDNVQHLMVTVEEQAKEILTLKMTVKDLKLKMEALENYETQPYNYDH